MKSIPCSISNRQAFSRWRTQGSRNTAACQLFITVANADYLTGMYTIFGQVVSGQDVADAISKVPTGANDKPIVPVVVKTVTIERKP